MTNKELLINYLTSKVNRTETWYEIAVKFEIGKGLTNQQRAKKANDIWRRFISRGIKAITEKTELKVLYLDLETSPNIGFFWKSGYKLNIGYENIIQERAIICACYKWKDENKVHSLEWNNGDDKVLLQELAEVINEADLIVGHNLNKFDLPWIYGRCVKHNIQFDTNFKKEDTLTMARNMFSFNSNKLDYIAQFLGLGEKLSTSYNLWKDIVLKNDAKAMNTMVKYCKNDVVILQKVHEKLCNYKKIK